MREFAEMSILRQHCLLRARTRKGCQLFPVRHEDGLPRGTAAGMHLPPGHLPKCA